MADESRPIRARATEVHGSNAGAGSGALALYRKHRRVELDRLDQIEKERERDEKNIAVHEKLEQYAEQDAARTEKNRKKRQRRKGSSKSKAEEDEHSDDLDPEEGKALLELAEAEAAAIVQASDVTAVRNDGEKEKEEQ